MPGRHERWEEDLSYKAVYFGMELHLGMHELEQVELNTCRDMLEKVLSSLPTHTGTAILTPQTKPD